MKLSDMVSLVKQTFSEWSEDKAPRLAAALSYYTIFSLAPLLVIIIAVAGLFFGQKAAQNQIFGQIKTVVGPQGAQAIQAMIASARNQGASIIATIIGIVTLLVGATGVFAQLHDALNTIWEVEPKKTGIVEVLKERLLSFTLILGIGFLLLVSLVIDSVLSSLSKPAANLFAGSGFLWEGINLAISFGISMLLFAMIFKILPEVEIEWGDVWLGAGVTALLFMIGKYLIGLYLGNTSIASSYGAAGSLVIVLVWIYYSAQILFLGAEFTQVYANRYGSRIVPEPGAKFVSEATRAEQGIPHKKKEEQKLEMESQGAKVGTQARPATGTSPLAARYQPNQALLPEARPSLLALSAIAASLIGFIGGLFIKRR